MLPNTTSRYINILALLVILLAFLIIKPLLTPILTAAILAYLFYPVYLKLLIGWTRLSKNKFEEAGKTVSALAIVVLVILTFLLPLWGLMMLFAMNLKVIISFFQGMLPLITNLANTAKPLLQSTFMEGVDIHLNLSQVFSTLAIQLFNVTKALFSEIPSFLFGSFITLFVMYYLLKNVTKILEFIREWIPLSEELRIQSLNRFSHLSRGLIGSQFIIAACQALLMGLACLILGLHHKALIIASTFIFAFVPFVGAFVVWLTLSIYLALGFLNGTEALWRPIFMVIYGSLLVSTIDNLIRPKLLSDVAKINPAIVLIGIIGGVILFGVPGIFLGPIILTFVEIALDVFRETYKKHP
ncbi:MAG: AI-2E family transporter [Candidatus Margulisiibacteriota bacterium]|mgnify:CR=1 FL=1